MAAIHMGKNGTGGATRCGKWINNPESITRALAQVTCRACLKAYGGATVVAQVSDHGNILEDGGELSAEEWQVIRAGQDPVSVCGTAGGHHDYVAIFPYTDKLRQYWRCSRCRRVAT